MQSMVHVHFDFEELQVDEYGYKMVMEMPRLYHWFEKALEEIQNHHHCQK